MALFAYIAEQLQDLTLDDAVERSRRLVGDDDLGVAHKRHGDVHPLSHAARKLSGVAFKDPGGIGDTDLREQEPRLFKRCAFSGVQ
jgi:hypothetical protein